MTSGCLQLLLAGSGNLSREKFLQRFHRLTPEKIFHEVIAEVFRQLHAICVSPVLLFFVSCSKPMWVWYLGTQFSAGAGIAGLMIGLNNLTGLFQP